MMATSAYSANGASRQRVKPQKESNGYTNGHVNGNGNKTAKTNGNANANAHGKIQRSGSAPRSQSQPQPQPKNFATSHTWFIPLILILTIGSIYALNPTQTNILHRFIFLSYEQPQTNPSTPIQYGKGLWDIAFVSFYTLILTFTREFIMQELLFPLAKAYIKSERKQARFMEQMYTVIYFAVTGAAGVYVMSRSPVWYFNTTAMYEGFPHRTHEAAFKFYYLFEAAYWAQQAIVMILGQEEKRKDFKELVGHHIVTLALIVLSYRFHFTYMGIVIYITHDISDFFLAISKSFHYTGSDLIIPALTINVFAWVYLRHYINLRVMYSILTEFRTVGPYELNWETQQYKCWISCIITFSLLAMLQGLNLFWLYCLGRSSWKFLAYGEKKDDRSDDSEEELEPEQIETEKE
ncbi:TRAM1-like protein [Penicillium angulare]|uniref:TRAM1-like protein n=1 Tax=Penicillium angulare TaxID=116970 RepID=UPI002541C340|nr:TRAM1-like protein [Penicillium angulare]KAJ5281420.1 TRAM1-like protein [Penicillium angulare]